MNFSASRSIVPAYAKSIPYSFELIYRPSVTPLDAGCQDWLADKLSALGFRCHQFEVEGVKNLIAEIGQGERTVAFAGHTDIVPPGDLGRWKSNPFEPVIIMDEQGIQIDQCIVGEPTAKNTTGDTIKVGRRGAVSAQVRVTGKQGHVAYPQYADNAIHKMAKVINALESIEWDEGSDDFPGTSLQITHIDSGEFTDNIVPAKCSICFNIRYSHNYTQTQLEALIDAQLSAVTSDFELEWERACAPYFTATGIEQFLIASVEKAIHRNTGKFPVLSTAGGTSDGRFFASEHTQVVEVGVPNKTIHQVNEQLIFQIW